MIYAEKFIDALNVLVTENCRNIDNRIAENENLLILEKDDEDKNAKANEMSQAMRLMPYRENKTF